MRPHPSPAPPEPAGDLLAGTPYLFADELGRLLAALARTTPPAAFGIG